MRNKEQQSQVSGLKSKVKEEELEISSTGYGYESVSKTEGTSVETDRTCGGL